MSDSLSLPYRLGLSAAAAAIPGVLTTGIVGWISDTEPTIVLFVFCAAPWMAGILFFMAHVDAEGAEKSARKKAWEAGRPAREAAAAAVRKREEAERERAAAERAAAAERLAAAERGAEQALYDDLVRDARRKLGGE